MTERNDYFETQLAYCADGAFLLAKQQALFIVERFLKYQLSQDKT